MKREYAQEPPMVSVTRLNATECEIMLCEGITTETREDIETGQTTIYLADEYTIIVPWREGLEEAVIDNTAAWLAVAKSAEHSRLAKEGRDRRNRLLAEIDWTQAIDAPISAASREALRKYRQALRDITDRPEFPYITDWPKCPTIEKGDPDPVDEALDVLLGGDSDA